MNIASVWEERRAGQEGEDIRGLLSDWMSSDENIYNLQSDLNMCSLKTAIWPPLVSRQQTNQIEKLEFHPQIGACLH